MKFLGQLLFIPGVLLSVFCLMGELVAIYKAIDWNAIIGLGIGLAIAYCGFYIFKKAHEPKK